MIQIKEAQISWFRPLKYGVSISLNIKEEDLEKVDRDKLEDFWKTWKSIVSIIQDFEEKTEKKENKKGYLALLMQKYCDKEVIPLTTEIERIYKKYNISSRAELTDEQVEYEIESYKAGLNFF